MAFDAATGRLVYSSVAFFTSNFVNVTADSIALVVESHALVLSPTHLVLASRARDEPPVFIQASAVLPGTHWAWLLEDDALQPRRVVSATAQRTTASWLTPKTLTGTIVASGFAASCHTEEHAAREALYAPYHAWLRAFPLEHGSAPALGWPWYHRATRLHGGGIVADLVVRAWS